MGRDDLINPDDPAVNARSQEVTIADGKNTHGTVNQHPSSNAGAVQANNSGLAPNTSSHSNDKDGGTGRIPFRVGMSEDRNKRWRRTMEDSHAFVYNFGGVQGQGFFSVFDGHAGKHSAEWCGKHFHEYFLKALEEKADLSVPDVLNETFHQVDKSLSKLAQEQGSSSGCTAVTAFLRLEDENGIPVAGAKTGGIVSHGKGGQAIIGGASAEGTQAQPPAQADTAGSAQVDGKGEEKGLPAKPDAGATEDGKADKKDGHSGGILRAFSRKQKTEDGKDKQDSDSDKRPGLEKSQSGLVSVTGKDVRRVLYTANVGDARAVLARGGKAIRLTYDHKGSDAQEAKRITDAGGYVMNNRVNGVLAVTRSLGDSSMKEFVVGAPYTTETTLSEEDTLLIVACDGLWDVVDDQDAVDLIKDLEDPQQASDALLRHALQNFSTDNTSVMVVRFAVHPSAISDPHPPTAAPMPAGE